jgi:phage FluMu protein Com
MAILACEHCAHLREVLKKEYIGKKVKCPACQKVTLVHDTMALMTKLFQQNVRFNKELVKLKQQPPLPSDKTTIAELRKENTRLVTLITELSKETSGLKEELVKLKQQPPLPSDKTTIAELRKENARLNEEVVKMAKRMRTTK